MKKFWAKLALLHLKYRVFMQEQIVLEMSIVINHAEKELIIARAKLTRLRGKLLVGLPSSEAVEEINATRRV